MPDARKKARATAVSGLSCGGRDFNFVKQVLLKGLDLLQPD
jgi:hypothetical protein